MNVCYCPIIYYKYTTIYTTLLLYAEENKHESTMWIRDGCGAGFGGGSGQHHAYEVRGVLHRFVFIIHVGTRLGFEELALDALIGDEMNDSLRDARIGGRHATVKAA